MKKKIIGILITLTMCLLHVRAGTVYASTYSPVISVLYRGSEYMLFDNSVKWNDARDFCETLGGHLATITSEEEQEVVCNLISKGGRNAYWLGATDQIETNKWEWVTGETFEYQNWARTEPDDEFEDGVTEDYVAMYNYDWENGGRTRGSWGDFSDYDVTKWSYEWFGFVCERETIKSVTSRGTIKSRHYGATVEDNTDKGEVYDLANDFNDACLNYIYAVHGVAKSDTGIDIKKAAEKLKEADSNSNEKWLTYVSLPDKAIDAAYMAYADYLQSIVNKGASLGKINLSDDIISINAKMINQIRDNITISSSTYNYNGFDISLSVTGYRNTSLGTMTLKKGSSSYIVTVCTKPTETANAICSYINELRDVTENVLRQGIQALVSELADITGFYDYRKELIEERVKKYIGKLREHGYGNVLNNIKKCYDGYDVIKDVIRWNDAKHITDELNNAEKLYKKISLLSYTDADVNNLVISQALDNLEMARKKLAGSLYNYVYHSTGSAPNEPGFCDKVNSWWSSLWQCPVDFTVYDESGTEIGYVRDDIVYYSDDIYIETSSDVKKLYVPQGMNVSLEMKGTDEGTFNYVVEEFSDGEPTGRLNYYDIPLTEETIYSQSLNTTSLSSEVDSIPIILDDRKINASEYLSADDMEAYVVITTECEGDGVVIGGGNYAKGDSVKLTAIASTNNYRFVGWYVNDELVSTDAIYQFTALENVTVNATFKKVNIVDLKCDVEMADSYIEDVFVKIYKTTDNLNEVEIVPYDDYEVNTDVMYKTYSFDGHIIKSNGELGLVCSDYSYMSCPIDFGDSYRIELVDANGIVIANITRDLSKELMLEDISKGYTHNDIKSSTVMMVSDTIDDISIFDTLYMTDGTEVREVTLSDVLTTKVTGPVEVGFLIKNIPYANVGAFQAKLGNSNSLGVK